MQILSNFVFIFIITTIAGSLSACDTGEQQTMEVLATAYTMRLAETKKGNKGLTAWGDQLEPGMKSIAVSRDLIKKGLGHKTVIRIDGLEGEYIVRDKMNKRWENKIDIFMGNLTEAREWGERKVVIRWGASKID